MDIDINLLRQIILTVPNYVFWKDKNLIYQGCNYNFALATGFSSPDDVVGKSDAEMPWADYTAKIYQEEDRQIINTKQSIIDKEVPMVMGTEDERTLFVSKVPLFDNKKNVIGVLGIYVDMTERKLAEQILKDLTKKLEIANRSKTQLLTALNHEIRTPLTNIVGVLELQKNEKLNPKEQERLKIVSDSVESILRLLENLTEYIDLEGNLLKPYLEEFDFPSLVDYIVKEATEQLDISKVKLILDMAYDIPTKLSGDPQNVYRILTTLITNAVRFTKNGKIIINVSCSKRTQQDLLLKFVVEDTGIGIEKEHQKRLFDLFTDGKKQQFSHQHYHLAGLRLSIIKQLVDNLNGAIKVESAVNQGSKFTVTLPFKFAHNTFERSSAKQKKKNQSIKVLLVEDTSSNQYVEKELLEKLGCIVDVANTGNEALIKASKHSYDLIILDINLPDISGIEVAYRLKTLLTANLPPMLAITALDSEEDKEACFESGISDVLVKPVKLDVIEAAINEQLNIEKD